MKQKRFLFIISIIMSILFIFLIMSNNIKWYDFNVYQTVSYFQNTNLTLVNKIFSFCCSPYVLIGIILTIFLITKNKKIFAGVTINLGLSFVLSYVLKEIFKRSRPIGINLVIETGYSMPSSHAMVAMAFYGFLIYLFIRNFSDKKYKYIVTILLSLLILLIGISRIYLGVHYASDVTLGFTIGLSYLLIYVDCFKKYLK